MGIISLDTFFSQRHFGPSSIERLLSDDLILDSRVVPEVRFQDGIEGDLLLSAPVTDLCGRGLEEEDDLLFEEEVQCIEKDGTPEGLCLEGYLFPEEKSAPLAGLSQESMEYLKKNSQPQLVLVELAEAIQENLPIKRVDSRMFYFRDKIWEPLADSALLREITLDILPCHDQLSTRQFNEIFKILQGKIMDYEELCLENAELQKLICFQNGIYDFMSDELKQHSSKYPFFSYIPFEFIPGEPGNGEVFDAYLDSICVGNDMVRERILQLIGYICSNLPNIKKIALLLGERDSGKTTLAKILAEIVGWENVQSFSFDGITRFTNHEMFGKKLALCTDLKGKKLSERSIEWLKNQTGGDVVFADVKFGKGYSYVGKCKYLIASNFRPNLGDDDALENRFLIIPFPESIPENRKNPNLLENIREEMQHVFYLAFDALRRFWRDGMIFADIGDWEYYIPNYYTQLHTDVAQFFQEKCYLDKDEKTSRRDMYDSYCAYCEERGDKAMSSAKFFREFKKIARESGITDDTNDGRKYKGVALR